ncbi:acyltransferase family protein [Microbacterium cremeum]|uniref:acyltransferase family protein n=1 Tax=Microbacterium cremeum TaxID=2782169 RepID=UPI0018891C84|nr:acyltransferase [Microbacterium cremeum]
MTLLDRPRTDTVGSAGAPRDAAMDLVRAACLVVVVALHAFMAGITVTGGEIGVTNVVIGQDWFAPMSWIVQMMPLFFLVGGFAGVTQWRRMRARGDSAVTFVTGRLRRLAVPAIAAFGVIGAGLSLALAAGVSPELVGELGFRMAQPMWFLGVYVGATALVPLLTWAHERAPWATLGAMVLGVVAVDALRLGTGIEALGYLNLAFVWLAVQQLGFWWADGRVATLPRGRLIVGLAASVATLAALFASGAYSPDMYVNLNPPTVCLVVLGAAQLFAFALAAPRLRRVAARPRVSAAVDAVGSRSMTIYLWHMPALVLFAAVLVGVGVPFAEPLSLAWWLTRPAWLVGVGVATALLVMLTDRFERRRMPLPGASAATTARAPASRRHRGP